MRRTLSLLCSLALAAAPAALFADTCTACGVGSCGGAATACIVEQTQQGSICLSAEFADGSSFSQGGGKAEMVVVPCN